MNTLKLNYNFSNLNILKEIKAFIEKANSIYIIPHIDPDADALGSAYALALILKAQGKNVKVLLNYKISQDPYFASYEKSFAVYDIPHEEVDLVITVDSANLKRLGKYQAMFQDQFKILVINIDHHIDNSYFGQINLVDASYSSTGEIIAELFLYMQWKMNLKIAALIYVAILSDTGSFRFSSTTSRTHYLVSLLLQYPIDTNLIYAHFFENFTLSYLQVRQKVYNHIELLLDGKVAITVLKKEFYEYPENFANFVQIGLSIKGVEASFHFIEKEEEFIKVSLRSRGSVNVNKIATYFGGGGHIQASSFSLERSYNEAKKMLLDYVIPLLKEEF